MPKFGLALSSEEFAAPDIVANAKLAENSNFDFCMVSDHYHPWIDKQGHSPFVWSTLGAMSQVTDHITIGTGVTCPTIRIHPAIIAQAAATAASLLENRFILGLGTGENLNEHIIGKGWPIISIRQAMLREAVEIIRTLWNGLNVNYRGNFFQVEDARIYSLPKILPPIFIAASGPISAKIAGQIADGLIVTSPDKKIINTFFDSGGQGKPVIAQMPVCYAATGDEAVNIVYQQWPLVAMKGQLTKEIRIPAYFNQAVKNISPADISSLIPLGPDTDSYLDSINKYYEAKVTHLYFHQIGPYQAGFINFFQNELRPELPK